MRLPALSSLPRLGDAPIAKGVRVLLRLCLNVPIADGKVSDDFRIRKVSPTLEWLLGRGALVRVISHLGSDGSQSLAPVEARLRQLCPGDYEVLPNLRIDPREKAGDESLARELALGQDVFVNEDFAASHREHASIVAVPKFLPSFVGLQFEREVDSLRRFFDPPRPCVVILGGAKLETKLPMINAFLPKAEKIFLGSYFATVPEQVPKDPKVVLPEDVVRKEGRIVDSGQRSLAAITGAVGRAASLIWNGPLGKFEDGFDETTNSIASAVAASKAESVLGGGDLIAAIEKLGIMDKFSFVSTGGGAMLEFLACGTLPGIEAILKSKK